MRRRLSCTVLMFVTLAACSDSHDRSPGSQTHFISCDTDADCNALGAQYTCQTGRCRIGKVVTHPMHESDAGGSGGTKSVDSGPSSSDAGTTVPICDGSDDIRIAIFHTTGWGGPQTDYFMQPFGIFVAIDGHCRYHATWTPMVGVVEGTLDAADADQLASDLHWDKFATFGGYEYKSPDCSDGGGAITTDGKHAFACLCGCDPAAPAGLEPITVMAGDWLMRLATKGTALDGPVSAAASVFSGGVGGVPPRGGMLPPGDPQVWPLSSPITDIVASENDLGDGRRFDDPDDSAALRSMRNTAFRRSAKATQIYATDGAQDYLLYVRDELDADVNTQVAAFYKVTMGDAHP